MENNANIIYLYKQSLNTITRFNLIQMDIMAWYNVPLVSYDMTTETHKK